MKSFKQMRFDNYDAYFICGLCGKKPTCFSYKYAKKHPFEGCLGYSHRPEARGNLAKEES